MTLVEHFREMALYNAWGNARLHAACVALEPGEFAAPRVGFFPSLQETLNHILITDWYYLDLLEGGGRGRAVQRVRIPYPEAQALLAARAEADRRLVAFCAGLDEAGLARTIRKDTEGVECDEPVAGLLTHLFVHQTHHRGQAHAMLSGTSVAPPQLDEFFLVHDGPKRAAGLARLGLQV